MSRFGTVEASRAVDENGQTAKIAGEANLQKLARYIAKELKTAKQCGVYHGELRRVWPKNSGRREKAVIEFAQKHGWRVRFYKDGLCAIFDKSPKV